MTPVEIKEQLRRKREAMQKPARRVELGDLRGNQEPPQNKVNGNGHSHEKIKLPQSTDAEKGVIGSILLAPQRCMLLVERTIGKNYFYHPSHAEIYEALTEMHYDSVPIDLISLSQYLEDTGRLEKVGGPGYVTEVINFVQTATNFSYYLDIIREKHTLRKLAELGDRIKAEAIGYNADPKTTIQVVSEEIDRINHLAVGEADEIESHTFEELEAFDTKNDPNSVLGYGWLCRGSSCLLVGQSGLGKSSFGTQAGIMWAQGLDLWGISPSQRGRRLKSLYIQAENDAGDMAEMMQGVLKACSIPEGVSRKDFVADIGKYVVFKRDAIHTGIEFARNARRLIEKEQPDLVWVDPLLSYVGDDISQQRVASQFLRNTLNPIALNTGIVWMILHHTGKPSTDPKAKAHWKEHDFSYAAFGSSELVNWARAVAVLRSLGNRIFELRLSKRGKRAGLREFDPFEGIDDARPPPKFTDVAYLQHAQEGIFWEQIAPPTPEELKPKSKRGQFQAIFKAEQILELLARDNIGRRTGEIQKLAKEELDMGRSTFYEFWNELTLATKVVYKQERWFVA